jgi:acyl-CoA thioester hydrolase
MTSSDQLSGAPSTPEVSFVRDGAFRLLLRVRYGECDMQKVVFNARYLDYVDIAITEYIRRLWGSPDELLARGMDYQAVHQSIDWKTSARADDILAIVMDTAALGRTSFTIHSEFRHAGSDALIARAQSVYVLIDPASGLKAEIPGAQKSALERGAPGAVVDFAGLGLGTPA